MNYKELETKMKKFIEVEPTLTDKEANTQAADLAKEMGLSVNTFWDLLDLSETSFYNHQLFVKCLKAKTIKYK
jgi:hypothetical protein